MCLNDARALDGFLLEHRYKREGEGERKLQVRARLPATLQPFDVKRKRTERCSTGLLSLRNSKDH